MVQKSSQYGEISTFRVPVSYIIISVQNTTFSTLCDVDWFVPQRCVLFNFLEKAKADLSKSERTLEDPEERLTTSCVRFSYNEENENIVAFWTPSRKCLPVTASSGNTKKPNGL